MRSPVVAHLMRRHHRGGLRPLTITGGVVADTQLGTQGVARSAGVEGDGQAVGSHAGVGIWPAATNLCTNGGFETNTTGWVDTRSTTTRITTDHKFGTACGESVATAAFAYTRFTFTLANGVYSLSLWQKTGAQVPTNAQIFVSDGVSNILSITDFTADTDWTRKSGQFTVAGSPANVFVDVYSRFAGGANGDAIRIDGVQIETGAVATPYIHTDGATATRTAGRIQVPSTGMSATAGAVIANFQPQWAATGTLPSDLKIWSWRPTGSNYLDLGFQDSSNAWRAEIQTAGGLDSQTLAASTHSAGDQIVLGFRYSSAALAVVANGGNWSAVARAAGIPTGLSPTFDIGRLGDQAALAWAMSNVRWVAFYGPGGQFLSDADSAHIGRLGAIIDPLSDLPRPDDLVAFWDGVNDYYVSYT